jgi:hypothetical protein
MKILLRVLLGAVLGVLAWAIAFFGAAALIVWRVWPLSLRMHHPNLIVTTSVLLVVTPCVFALGLIFRRMFSAHRALCAIAAMSVALVFESALTVFPPGSPVLVVLPFLFGPLVVANLLDFLRHSPRGSGT